MLLFIILGLMVLLLTIFLALIISAGGTMFVILFSDVIVCIAIIVWIIRRIRKKKE